MSRTVPIVLLVFLVAFGINVWAQQGHNKAAGKPAAQTKAWHPKLLKPDVYWGAAGFHGGKISKNDFKTLLVASLNAHDSAGNKYKVMGFDFTFAEHVLYSDPGGNDEVLVDYSSQNCEGDTLSSSISGNLYEPTARGDSIFRIKAGDTVFVEHIMLMKYPGNTLLSENDTNVIEGKSIKCVIIK